MTYCVCVRFLLTGSSVCRLTILWSASRSDVGAGHLCHLLSYNSSLAHLNVSNNCLTAKGAVVFADGVYKNDFIKSLQVNAAFFEHAGGAAPCKLVDRGAPV